jgi:hypothetical protein
MARLAEVQQAADTANLNTGKTHEAMDHLAQNTNSKMDLLLKTTSEAEHAKGVLEGRADQTGPPPQETP